MLTSVFYPPREVAEKLDDENQFGKLDGFHLFQILFMKAALIAGCIVLPLLMKDDHACLILAVLVALEFWTSKNISRKFLKAYWYVDTSTEKDRWVFEAKSKPTDAFQGVFWYSFLGYLIVLFVVLVFYLSRFSKHMSITCTVLIAIICAYLNFFAYSKIIRSRNSGLLQNLCEGVGMNAPNDATVQMPLITVKSELKDRD